MRKFDFFKAFTFLVALCAPIHICSDNVEELDRFIEQVQKEKNVPGVAVAVVKGDKIIFAKGYGIRRTGESGKVDKNTIFQLASVSKTFASAGLGVQVDKKKIGWDDEVLNYLPGFSLQDMYAARYTTSRDLLAHRTGLPAFTGDLLGKLGYTSEEILYKTRYIKPGASFREKALYSNVGYFIAGQLLAKLSGTTWQKAIQSTLLDPLRMTRSGFADNLSNSNVSANHAIIEGKLQAVEPDRSILFVAAGGVTSTASDLGNWMIMHLNGGVFEGKQILSAETIAEMHAPSMVSEATFAEMPPIYEDSSFSFGMGWDNYNYKGRFIVEKAGALDGVRTVITLVPEEKVGIVVLANLNLTVLPELVRAKFLDLYVAKDNEEKANKDFKKKEAFIAKLIEPPVIEKGALPFNRPIDSILGVYENNLYGKFEIKEQDKQLYIIAGPAEFKGSFKHLSNDTFVLKWTGVNTGIDEVTFVFGQDGKATAMQTGAYGDFTRVKQK